MKSYIFYSSNCVHSMNLVELIKNEKILDEFIMIELESNKDKIPSYITKVPTIISNNLAKPLIGGIECLNWINNRKYFNNTRIRRNKMYCKLFNIIIRVISLQ